MLPQIYRFLKTRILYSKTSKLMRKGDFSAALATLAGVLRLYGHEEAHYNSPVIANLLYADILKFSGDKHRCYATCMIVLDQLKNRMYSRDKLSIHDISYLRYKCKWIIAEIAEYSDSEAFKTALGIGEHYGLIDVSKTDPLIVSLFPISEKDGKDLDQFILQNT